MSVKSWLLNKFPILHKDSYFDWSLLQDKLKPKHKTLDKISGEYLEYQYPQLRQICKNTASIVNARIVLKETIFKNRFEWQPKFAVKCTNPDCGMEYDKAVETCDKCGSLTRKPNIAQQKRADEFFKSVNEFDQSLIELLEDLEDEVNMTDHGWLWLQKDYHFIPVTVNGGEQFTFIDSHVISIEKIYPEFIKHYLDKDGRHKEGYFCVEHRDEYSESPGFCEKCGKELLKAWYVYKDSDKKIFYAKDEIIWWTFYDSNGYSPVYAILKLVLTEWGMDDELYERYWKKVLPKAILAVNTLNMHSLDKVKHEIIEQAKKNEVPLIGIESQTGRGDMKMIRLTDDSVTDLTNEPTRDLVKKNVNTIYGVVPLYSADVERASALSGEGQQLMVQEDRAKAKQAVYNEMVLPKLLDELKVSDWILQLKSPMEETEMRKLEIEAKKIANARGMFDMGFDVELDDDGNFVFSGEAKQPEVIAPSPFAKSAEEKDDVISQEDTLLIKARWEEVLEAIREGALWEDYEGLTKKEVAQLNEILEREFTQPYVSLNRITEKIMKSIGLSKARARLIGRTEMSAVLNKARELDYEERDPEGEFKYKWLNPMDKFPDGTWRTTKQCREIVRRTQKGVTMKELKAIVKEVAEKYAEKGFKYTREFVPHLGCRSSYAKVV